MGIGKCGTSAYFSIALVSMFNRTALSSHFFLVSTMLWTQPLACSDPNGPSITPSFRNSSSFSLRGFIRCTGTGLCLCATGCAPSFMYICMGGIFATPMPEKSSLNCTRMASMSLSMSTWVCPPDAISVGFSFFMLWMCPTVSTVSPG